MTARVNPKVERAMRDAMGHAAHAEVGKIEPALAVLHDRERTQALALSMAVACYVTVDACGGQWPDDGDLRQIAHDLATTGESARQMQLDASEIHAYLSRVVLGPELVEDVIPDDSRAARIAIIVAQRAAVVYSPKGMDTWSYLDQIESALEVASTLDATVLPAAVMRAYLPKAAEAR